jgi:Spy/CpxP family protein refolding chaperone
MTRTKLTGALGAVAAVLLLALPAAAQPAPAPPLPTTAPAWQPERPALPVIGAILEQRDALGLSASQVEALERLSLDLIRDGIRRQAELMIAQVDLDALLDQDPAKAVDVAAAEAKVREIEKLRTDLQLAMIRAVEAAKAQLTAEQRSKLAALLTGARPPAVVQGPPAYGQPPAPLSWYCRSAQAYYPYVSSCPEPWLPVPAPPR